MRIAIILGLLLIAGPAFAQQPQHYTFTVAPSEAGIILNALGARPYNEVVELIAKLQGQAVAQQKAATAPVPGSIPIPVPAPQAKE